MQRDTGGDMTDYLRLISKLKACVRDADRIKDFGEYVVLIAVVSKLFYDSFLAMIPLFAGIIFYKKYKENNRRRQREQNVRQEFICALDGICSALSAGYSLTNSFSQAARQVKKVYGEECVTYQDFMIMVRQISLNRNMGEIMTKYAGRSLIDEIQYFCSIIPISVKEGADITGVIKEIRSMAIEKSELERQIEVVSSAKRSEAVVMSLMPIGIMSYLRVSSATFFDEMYGNIKGVVIMTIILAVYVLFVVMADYIGRIR